MPSLVHENKAKRECERSHYALVGPRHLGLLANHGETLVRGTSRQYSGCVD